MMFLRFTGSGEELDEFVDKRFVHVIKTEQFQASCHDWLAQEDSVRRDKQDRLRKERLDDICARLRPLGWEPELSMLEQDGSRLLSNHRLVCMTSKLTEHGA
ncbi:uncharacterized protein B0H18DRAFT_661945 [Fomitopsis serialis]|uniref:uncharacterized protein n=1 Tax=Fomitopsis serialis TaxID=139415 RepID=UPI002008579D|nr:uncharacterized protein B0H18DRAFT_661945 [Neoantrodia serialis]KAH9918635.1 hypothetical protein B0H18DRAFT_661945 [Neoantrodia serialis]